MDLFRRCFLVAEGPKNGYPNYKRNRIIITPDEPATLKFKNTFLCSPIFSCNDEGNPLPNIEDEAIITFFMVPNVYPGFSEIIKLGGVGGQIWFSIGLANIIIFENPGNNIASNDILKHLISKKNVTGAERWTIKDSHIENHELIFEQEDTGVFNCNLVVSEKLPLNLKFAVSEYIISVERLLTASKRFTPHYFQSHLKTITVTNRILVNDLSFLNGDYTFEPSSSVIARLDAKTPEEAAHNLENDLYREKKEDLINDRHGRIIQFNSSLSYLYSQAYSGTFPLFDHNAIIQRYSFLGVGSAISALYELVSQIEEAFALLPFDDFRKTTFGNMKVPVNYVSIFSDPSQYSSDLFKNDPVSEDIQQKTASIKKEDFNESLASEYYNRFAFFSGRLGFREYDFSATSAIQVLVESHSLEWHVINYTHEIIHNHVRTILTRNLINIPTSIRGKDYLLWLQDSLSTIKKIIKREVSIDFTYKEYFTYAIINYCINSKYFGSLTRESDHILVEDRRAHYDQPSARQLRGIVKAIYKDINEIFVHVIDFAYIYKRDYKAYVLSIWASWSTIPSVIVDVKQYIVRTLMILGLGKKGSSKDRYEQAKITFLSLIPELNKRRSAFVFEQIKGCLEDGENDDLLYRFSNCIILGDVVYKFFVGSIEGLLENGDQNVVGSEFGAVGESVDDEEGQIYDLETGNFTNTTVRSKVVFLLDQLLRKVKSKDESVSQLDEERERISAWLLLTLSSNNQL